MIEKERKIRLEGDCFQRLMVMSIAMVMAVPQKEEPSLSSLWIEENSETSHEKRIEETMAGG